MRKLNKGLLGAALVLGTYIAMPGPQQALAQRQSQPGFDVPVCEGEISTFALGNVPSGPRYWVDIFDKTDEALKFREVFLATLQNSGRGTGEEGQLVFTFESQSNFLGLVPRSSGSRFARDTRGPRIRGPRSAFLNSVTRSAVMRMAAGPAQASARRSTRKWSCVTAQRDGSPGWRPSAADRSRVTGRS